MSQENEIIDSGAGANLRTVQEARKVGFLTTEETQDLTGKGKRTLDRLVFTWKEENREQGVGGDALSRTVPHHVIIQLPYLGQQKNHNLFLEEWLLEFYKLTPREPHRIMAETEAYDPSVGSMRRDITHGAPTGAGQHSPRPVDDSSLVVSGVRSALVVELGESLKGGVDGALEGVATVLAHLNEYRSKSQEQEKHIELITEHIETQKHTLHEEREKAVDLQKKVFESDLEKNDLSHEIKNQQFHVERISKSQTLLKSASLVSLFGSIIMFGLVVFGAQQCSQAKEESARVTERYESSQGKTRDSENKLKALEKELKEAKQQVITKDSQLEERYLTVERKNKELIELQKKQLSLQDKLQTLEEGSFDTEEPPLLTP